MKSNYTISCINETQSLENLQEASIIFLRTKLLPDQINQKEITKTVSSFIQGLTQNQLLYILQTEEQHILGDNHITTVGYAWITKKENKQIEIYSLLIKPKRRKQGAGQFLLSQILRKHHDARSIYSQIYSQQDYDKHFNDYDEVYSRKIPSLNKEQLLNFLEKQGFQFHETHKQLYALYFPTTTPPTDANTGPSCDQ